MVELTGKVGEEIHIFKNVLAADSGLLKEASLVKRYFRNSSFEIERCVPCAALRFMKASSKRTGVAESRINDLCLRNAKQQLVRANSCASAAFGYLALVCGCIQLAQVRDHVPGQR